MNHHNHPVVSEIPKDLLTCIESTVQAIPVPLPYTKCEWMRQTGNGNDNEWVIQPILATNTNKFGAHGVFVDAFLVALTQKMAELFPEKYQATHCVVSYIHKIVITAL